MKADGAAAPESAGNDARAGNEPDARVPGAGPGAPNAARPAGTAGAS